MVRGTPVPLEISESFGQACAVEGVRIVTVLAIRKLTVCGTKNGVGRLENGLLIRPLPVARCITDMFGASHEVATWRGSLSRSLFSLLNSHSDRSVVYTAQRFERGKMPRPRIGNRGPIVRVKRKWSP